MLALAPLTSSQAGPTQASPAQASPAQASPTLQTLGRLPVAAARERIAALARRGLALPAPTADVELLRVRYASTDAKGEPRTLSGLLARPEGSARGTVLYFHGTIADRALSPSRYDGATYNGASRNAEAELVALAFASGGYSVLLPDGLGLGDDPGIHPYPIARVNARAGTDMVAALDARGPLCVAGYSEGGAVAMWATRAFEAAGRPLAASAPMSGPYDLSGVTLRSLLKGGQGVVGLGEKLFLMGYSAYSARAYAPGVDLRDYFAPSMATYIPYLFDQKLPAGELGKRLVIKAFQMGVFTSIQPALTPRFLRAIQTGDFAGDPVLTELRANDTFDWSPATPMLLPYLVNDGVVVPENTTRTLGAMRARGIGPDRVRSFPIPARRGLAHGEALGPAILAARAFFDGGFGAVPFPTAELTGTVRVAGGALPPGATIRATLVDASAKVGEANALAETAFPAGAREFRLTYGRDLIVPGRRYTLDGVASLGGEIVGTTREPAPVLTGRGSRRATLVLETTAGDRAFR